MNTLEVIAEKPSCTRLDDRRVSEIQRLIQDGIEAWFKAGVMIAELLDASKDVEADRDLLSEKLKVGVEIVDRFYAIGKRYIHPPLLIMDGPGAQALLKCPFEVQYRHTTEPVEVLIQVDGKWETLKIAVRNLTSEQARQVFSSGNIRSIGAQRAYIESLKMSKFNPHAKMDEPYRIIRKKLVIRNGPSFTASDLARILVEMER